MTVPHAEADDRREALDRVPVSRETAACLDLYVERLKAWQRVKNLVAASTLDRVWTRHIEDSAQLLALAPDARRWVDLGSGAGFPGLVIAILLRGRPGAAVHLIESNGRKGAFLREVARLTGAPAKVHVGRIEAELATVPAPVDIVTSRALAPLPALIATSRSLLDCGARGLFLTGETAAGALADSEGPPVYRVRAIPSRTEAGAAIMEVVRSDGP